MPRGKLATSGVQPGRRGTSGLTRAVAVASWSYLALIVAVWALVAAADSWWPATVLMYGPRWLLAVPLVVLIPAALVTRRRLLGISLLAMAVLIVPVMGLCLPWRMAFAPETHGLRLRVFSCNVHYKGFDPGVLRALVKNEGADIFVLQSYPATPAIEPLDLPGWHVRLDNELFCASRYPIRQVQVIGEESAGPIGAAVRYELETSEGVIHFVNLHLATPRNALGAVLAMRREAVADVEANSELRDRQSETIRREVEHVSGPVLIAGDFNTTTESAIYRHYWGEYTNAFSTAGWGWGYTFWTRWAPVRIDHILAGPGWRCRGCRVGRNIGSPHRPVIADLEWIGSQD